MKINNIYSKGIILLSIIGSIGFSSCGVINKKYQSPEIGTEGLFRDTNTTDTTSVANIPWRSYFSDPYLQTLIEDGLKNNYDMLIVLERIKQADAALGMAKAAWLPSVAITGQATHNRVSSASLDIGTPTNPGATIQLPEKVLGYTKNDYRLGIAATWELDLWGKLNSQKKSRYAQYLNSLEGRKLLQTNLVSGIATMYYTLLALDEQLKASNEAILLLEETLSMIEAMKEAGATNGAAVEQTKAALYGTKINIPNLEKSIKELENNLCLTIGRKPDRISRGSFESQKVVNELKTGTPAKLLANRPDVRSAELSFRSAFEMTNAAQASFYPSISLSPGMIGYVSMVEKFFDPKNLALSIAGNLTQPIFARKQLKTQLTVAKADQEIALLSLKKAVLNAGIEVSNILHTHDFSLKKNELREKQIESLIKSVEYTQLLLKAGEIGSYLEVIKAEQDLLQAQIGKINDKLEQLQNNVNLYKALGGGIE